MNINELEEAINKLAADLILLDSFSKESMDAFSGTLNILKTAYEGAHSDVFQSITTTSQQILSDIADETDKKTSVILACIVSSLQNLIKDIKQDADVSGHVDRFKKDINALMGGDNPAEPPQTNMAESQTKAIPEFISNTQTLLEEIEADLLDIEKSENPQDKVNNIFRAFHTLKGESNLLNFKNLNTLAHKAEDLLECIRFNTLCVDDNINTVLLKTVDAVKQFVKALSSDPSLAVNIDLSDVTAEIENIITSKFEDNSDETEEVQIIENEVQKEDQPVEEVSLEPQEPQESEEKTEEIEIEPFTAKVPELDLSEGTDILSEFLTEATEDHLNNIEDGIMTLEKDPQDKEAVDAVFRAFHTIKGLAGFLELEDIRTLAHDSETMLDMVRKGTLGFDGIVVDLTFESVDCLKKLFELLSEQLANGGELQSPYFDVGRQIQRLREVIAGKVPVSTKPIGEILVEEGDITSDELEKALEIQNKEHPEKKVGEILQDNNAASAKDVKKAVNIQKGAVENSIKIRVDKLDALIDLVGELVISETQVVQNPVIKQIDNQRIAKDLAEVDRITRRLQEVAMGMRLIPVKQTFQKMQRIIRDLSKKSNKDIDVVLIGEDTEIDKNMVELISDPLVHMVRNSCDHGIEVGDVREAKGKPRAGNVQLAAFHKGGNVVIEIRDDGAGLNKDKILQKAIDRGLVKEGEKVPDNRICHMIFEPGFSTADQVTDISGRGVGMDVVKRNIEQLRGKIDITTEQDKGSVFAIQLPITLAIIEGIVILVGGERYILPIHSILEFVQPLPKNLINIVDKGDIYKVHEEVYPLVRMDHFFGVSSKVSDFEEKVICLVESDYGRACLLVDELLGQQQVVIKSLGERFKDVSGISGGAILGDGQVGLILDVNGVISRAREGFSQEAEYAEASV